MIVDTFIPPSVEQAHMVAWARHEYKSLNFGDCFAYALAKMEGLPLLTLDSDFKKVDIEVRILSRQENLRT